MHILVSGGTGLIGRPLAARLVNDGHKVTILTRSPRAADEFEVKVELLAWDGQTTDGWREVINEVDAVIHLAGANVAGEGMFPDRWTPERKQLILQSRLQSGQALVAAIRAAEKKPKLFVQASAIGYYGSDLSAERLAEGSPSGDDFLAQVCVDWEASTAEVEEMGVRRVILRTGVVFSMAGGALPSLVLPFKFFAGGPVGSGRQWISWIHMDDEIEAIVFLLESESAAGVYNLTAPQALTNRDLATAIGKVMGRPALVPTPAVAMKLMFGEVATVIVEGQHVYPKNLLEAGFKFKYSQVEPALRDLLA
ncbi:MAG TPA: TIGR01777 family oxidoreductase [Anaerolineae bacterium]|nr:TIGR01777 family oxidoreductase [Anaerolineae bacterium]